MGKVLSHMTMSLDGFIADPKDNPDEIFEWYEAGDVDDRDAQQGRAHSRSMKPARRR